MLRQSGSGWQLLRYSLEFKLEFITSHVTHLYVSLIQDANIHQILRLVHLCDIYPVEQTCKQGARRRLCSIELSLRQTLGGDGIGTDEPESVPSLQSTLGMKKRDVTCSVSYHIWCDLSEIVHKMVCDTC